jgi:riboflavin synthase
MFTGIIQEIGTLQRVSPGVAYKLRIRAKKTLDGIELGDSICVNGTCLTVVDFDNESFEVDAMPETIEKTTLKFLQMGSRVNLEPSLKVGSKLGGHWVTGHVDGTGKILAKKRVGNAVEYEISMANELSKHLIPKGSVAVDGISLTLIECGAESFRVGIIPHTFAETTLGDKGVGEFVNLETDVIGKYVYKYTGGASEQEVTENLLRESGFM